MARKSLTQFDSEKDEWYYQPKIYINRQDSDTLYEELEEFRQSLSKDQDNALFIGNLNELLAEGQKDGNVMKSKGEIRMDASKGINGRPDDLNSGGFFDEKFKVLKDEIEDINRNLEERERIEKISSESIDSEIKEVKRQLHEIYTWKKGEKSTIEFIRMEFLKQLASLYREKRQGGLGFWKDRVFEKKDRRNLLLEYKSLDWAGTLSTKSDKESG